MNVINKMVLIPEKEYHLLKSNLNNADNVPADEVSKMSKIEDDKTDPKIDLNEYKESFKKAVQKYEKKLSKRPKKDKKVVKCQTLNWTNVKNF